MADTHHHHHQSVSLGAVLRQGFSNKAPYWHSELHKAALSTAQDRPVDSDPTIWSHKSRSFRDKCTILFHIYCHQLQWSNSAKWV